MKFQKISLFAAAGIWLLQAVCFSQSETATPTPSGEEGLIAPPPVEEIRDQVIPVEEVVPSANEAENLVTPSPTPAESASEPQNEPDAKPQVRKPEVKLEEEIENEEESGAEKPLIEDFLPPPGEEADESFLEEQTPSEVTEPTPPVTTAGPPVQPTLAKYRDLRIRTEKHPAVQELKKKAEKAKTIEQYRAAMRAYYRELFRRMRKSDPSLKEKIDAMEKAYLERLAQSRIEPTIPTSPPPTPEPLE